MSIKRILRNRMGVFGIAILGIFMVLAVAGPWLAPYGVDDQDLLAVFQAPSVQHLFGTDELGRDIFSRVLVGARSSTITPLIGVGLGATFGIVMGLLSGFYGGRVETVLMGLVDLIITFPSIILAIAIVSVIGVGEKSLALAIAVTSLPGPARIARGATVSIKQMEYFMAAKALGIRDNRILVRHLVPNIVSPLVVQVTLELSQAVLLSAALGFLGLGVQPPAPEWGTMLSQARSSIALAPHMMWAPGLAIALLVLGFNLTGDALRDALDPTLKDVM